MEGHRYVLGIDCGTQSLRVALYRSDGVQVATASAPYPTDRPNINWAEQNPHHWWEALCQAVPRCLSQAQVPPDTIAALACDGTSCTVVFSDEAGIPLRPAILWMDIRAAAEAQCVEATGDAVLEYCGRRISPEWLLPKVLWVHREQPEVYRRAARIVEGVDWLVYRLTGRWVTSNSNAAGKRHWTPLTSWPVDLHEGLGLERMDAKAPDEVIYLGDPVAPLDPEAAAALGLSRSCVVAHGGMDGWTAFVGKNCFVPEAVSLTLGTSNVVIAETDRPRPIDGVMGPFPDGLRRGTCVYEAGQASGGSIIQWFLEIAGLAGDPKAHRTLESEAGSVPPGADGLVVFDAWRGNRTPYFDPLARGNICGLTLEHTRAHVYRALLEGAAYGLRNVLATLESGGQSIAELRACGSGSGNRLYAGIIADVTRRPVLISREKEATCLGSAVCAAVAAGFYGRLPEAAAAMAPEFDPVEPTGCADHYDAFFERYLETYQRMKDTMHGLAGMNREPTS
ncbi:MAG TPA: FGGY-family carbohydrate kinase [Candidatus Hydrogenedentes bacterium]|nr:FGGY-family carbohydrate kinase [Candidatus Hydrogenedentota bacterium]HPG66036.1 FGGY-family carbohydrate kinase [Candidatus Hydrogenedentota bacterium]